MAGCDIVVRVNAVVASYRALCDRCCAAGIALLPDLSTMCGSGSGLLTEIFSAVLLLIGGWGSCDAMTEAESAPRPEIPSSMTCLSETWLIQCKAWIDGITCGGTPVPPGSHCCWLCHSAKDTYTVMLRGLKGSFLSYNGDHVVRCVARVEDGPSLWGWDCAWSTSEVYRSPGSVMFFMNGAPGWYHYVFIWIDEDCHRSWLKPAFVDCAGVGAMPDEPLLHCVCGDPESCEPASCVVV